MMKYNVHTCTIVNSVVLTSSRDDREFNRIMDGFKHRNKQLF